MNYKRVISLPFFFLMFFLLSFPSFTAPDADSDTNSAALSNIAGSQKRILKDDPSRDAKLLLLTGNDGLTAEIIKQHSLIVGTKIVLVGRQQVYYWLVEHIRTSAALSRLFGRKYVVSTGSVYEYHGEDGEGLSVDFYRAYIDSVSAVYTGSGKMKVFLLTISGSFINFLEYYNTDSTLLTSQNSMYIRVNNPVTRLVTNIIFAISDIERGLMEKILSLDDTVYSIVNIFMEDPYIYRMLKNPEAPVPEGASEIAVRIRDTVVRETSPGEARELGQLIENAWREVGRLK